ncbi:unnamed protein product [Cylindrotheca closterium]|uniref:Uncharacterized protein n=1 Tax=Cylindrotheca closterium TaxID=2856 RepID=A0AAD2CN29_9STRA|nr:unnamed protein product [Cylindrotheca closterium]
MNTNNATFCPFPFASLKPFENYSHDRVDICWNLPKSKIYWSCNVLILLPLYQFFLHDCQALFNMTHSLMSEQISNQKPTNGFSRRRRGSDLSPSKN